MASLSLRHITKRYGPTRVLDGIDLDIRDGEFLTLVGPSGCGKSTLLRIIAGLDHADAGEVCIDGLPVDTLAPKARDVAMVFQSYALYPYMSVAQNMALPLMMRRLSALQRLPLLGRWMPGAASARQRIDAEVTEVAAALGLDALLARRPAQLSGGQRQRVALGRAMVRHPKVFLMDEPLSNLDAKLRVETRAEIADLHRRLATTFVYVTHDQVEAMTMSDRVALMMDGRILQLAPPQEIYDDPLDLRVAEFIGTPRINTLAARVAPEGLRVADADWPVRMPAPPGAGCTAAVRAEHWRLGPVGGRDDCGLRGRIRHLEALGGETLVHVEIADQARPVVARVEPQRARGLTIGDPIDLSAPASAVLVFDLDGRRMRPDAAALHTRPGVALA